jgi:hypothetical protein
MRKEHVPKQRGSHSCRLSTVSNCHAENGDLSGKSGIRTSSEGDTPGFSRFSRIRHQCQCWVYSKNDPPEGKGGWIFEPYEDYEPPVWSAVFPTEEEALAAAWYQLVGSDDDEAGS